MKIGIYFVCTLSPCKKHILIKKHSINPAISLDGSEGMLKFDKTHDKRQGFYSKMFFNDPP